MNTETRQCQNCRGSFIIEPDDFAFYEKLAVPAPTLCPVCRRTRRAVWRNDLNFYQRPCGLCGKSTITLYSPERGLPVYCVKCWWSDGWDPKSFGREFDFSRPFFEQFREFQNVVPLLAMVNDNGIASVGCEYTQDFAFGKNCYLVLISWKVEDCSYSYYLLDGKQLIDCIQIGGGSEFLYDSTYVQQSARSRNLCYSSGMVDSAFCFDCRDCTNCTMCVGLRRKRYCFKNKELTKEEYAKAVADLRLHTRSGTRKAQREFDAFILQFPRRFANLKQCVNAVGDELWNAKNVYYVFNTPKSENCKYYESGDAPKDSYDCLVGGELESCYESITCDHSNRALFSIFSWKNTDVAYCENCHSCANCFGCSGLRNAQYCILNRQYTPEAYEETVARVREHMKAGGEWGEFFPASLSHFGYNETVAQDFYPLGREAALAKGYAWQDSFPLTTGRETMKPEEVPDSITDTPDSIVNEILACGACGRNYRIIESELQFYRRMHIPVPSECFYCRTRSRLARRNPYFALARRSCQCAGQKSENGIYQNTVKHQHGDAPCPNEFETSYAPDRKETVYCENCYNAEVV